MMSGLFGFFLLSVFLFVVPLVLRIKYMEYQVKKLHKQKADVRARHAKSIEALKVLCLPQNPTKREIRDAHRKMMAQNHPDIGGSKVVAAKINIARDVLMQEAA